MLEALDTVRPYMESHGGNVELLGIEDGVAQLALQGSCNGCAASRATLELAIKQALDEHAPDLAGLEVEGVTDPVPMAGIEPATTGGFELPMVHAGTGAAGRAERRRSPSWVAAGRCAPGSPAARWCASRSMACALLLANVDGSLLAYRDACAACGDPLRRRRARAAACCAAPACGVEFDLPRAGRAAGGEPLQLTPVPLLEAGGVRVAV